MGQYWSSRLACVWGVGERIEAIIYRVQCRATNKTYVGSTSCLDINRRLRVHEAHHRAWKKGRAAWCSVFEVLDGNDYYIEELEGVKSSDREIIRKRERYYLDLFTGLTVNKRSSYRQPWERKSQHRDAMRAYQQRNRAKTQKRVRESNAVKVKCVPCDQWMSRGYRAQHKRTYKHLSNVPGEIHFNPATP